ncbi:MAG: hypothetical protein LBR07_06955 [Puniceicoccales bacterium]|jgi:hypothetical protein|nr:hypothetical protein [Puniceicoccales bacterium]
MSRKKLFKAATLLAPLALAGLAPRAAAGIPALSSPLVELGDRSCGYFVLDTSATWSDNIYGAGLRIDDMIYTVSPGFNLDFGRDSVNTLSIAFRETFVDYMQHSGIDTQLASGSISWSFDPQSRLRLGASASFTQVAQNDQTMWVPALQRDASGAILYGVDGRPIQATDANGNAIYEEEGHILRRDLYSAGVHASYNISSKVNADVSLNWSMEHYRDYRTIYNDRQTFTVPASLFYQIFEKYYLGISYNYSYTDIQQKENDNYDPGYQHSHYVGLSTKGPLTSRLTLRGSVGWGVTYYEGRSVMYEDTFAFQSYRVQIDDYTYSTLNFSLALDYVGNKWRVSLMGARSFQLSGTASSYTNTYGRLNFQAWLTEKWSYYAYFGYAYQDYYYYKRHDQVLTYGGGIDYHPNRYWRIGVGYAGLRDISTRIKDFYINSISINASLKY